MKHLRDSERGAVILIVAGAMVLLLAIAALVLDLAALRADRARARTVSDQAATAGSLELWNGDGESACETALAYVNLNMHGDPFIPTGAGCTSLLSSCGPGDPALSATFTSGQWTATVTYPVPNGHAFLDPAAIGATTQAIHTEDGQECERLGVQIEGTRQFFFANVLGAASGDTEVHAVARATPSDSADLVLNLLILERYDCDAISAAGSGGGNGGIVTAAIDNPGDASAIPPIPASVDPGWIAVDSDASSGVDCSANGVLDVDGQNAFIRADGPAGCPGELATGAGHGCGEIRILADGQPYPGCNQPACTEGSGTVAPWPERLPRRVTRAPVDHRYNCKPGYSFDPGYGISPCTKQPPSPPWIDTLVGFYGGGGPPTGFPTYGGPCVIPPGTSISISGNIYIDCAPRLRVNGEIIFTGGDVVLEHGVALSSDGRLSFNTDGGDPRIFYLRDGELSKAGGADLYLWETTVYMSETANLNLGGGSGELIWHAKNEPGYRFDDLALWSEGTAEHSFAGQAVLDLEGVFFTPRALASYTGQGFQQQVSAQFIAKKLRSGGQGLLVVAPKFDQAVLFPELLDIQLIR